MFKLFDEYRYSFIFWFYFALITVIVRQYYLEEKYFYINIFPTKIDTIFTCVFFLFVLYTLYIFVLLLKKSKEKSSNRFLSFLGNIAVTLHLIYTISQTYNISNIAFLKDYYIHSQINELKNELPINVNSFTDLVDISVKDNLIKYVYQLKKEKSQIDIIDLKSFKSGVKDSLCNEAYSLNVLKYDYTLKYSYIDVNQKDIAVVNTTKEDCGESIYDMDYLKLILANKDLNNL